MKSVILKLACAFAILTPPISSYAKVDGGRESGGGTFVSIDGRVELSDRYYKAIGTPKRFSDFSQEVKDYLSNLETLLKKLHISKATFWDETVRGSKSLYIYVPAGQENKVPCEKYLPELTSPVKEHFQFGCRGKGNLTYLFEAFKRATTVREIALAILHERLWVANPNVDQMFIATFTSVIGELMDRHDNQVYRNNRDALSDLDLAKYDQLEMAAEQLGFITGFYERRGENQFTQIKGNLSQFIAKNGGGVVYDAHCTSDSSCNGQDKWYEVDPSAFIGVGSVVSRKVSYNHAAILDSEINHKVKSISNSTIMNSKITSSIISDSAITNSIISESGISNSMVQDSKIYTTQLRGESELKINVTSSNIVGRSYYKLNNIIEAGVSINKFDSVGTLYSDLSPGSNITIQRGATLNNIYLKQDYRMEIKVTPNTSISNLTLVNTNDVWADFLDQKLTFDSAQPIDFADLNCTIDNRLTTVKSASDLKSLCK